MGQLGVCVCCVRDDVALARITRELESLSDFVSGTLPSAGLASFGLFAGFKRSV